MSKFRGYVTDFPEVLKHSVCLSVCGDMSCSCRGCHTDPRPIHPLAKNYIREGDPYDLIYCVANYCVAHANTLPEYRIAPFRSCDPADTIVVKSGTDNITFDGRAITWDAAGDELQPGRYVVQPHLQFNDDQAQEIGRWKGPTRNIVILGAVAIPGSP